MTTVQIEYEQTVVDLQPGSNEVTLKIDNQPSISVVAAIGLTNVAIAGGGVSLDPNNALSEGTDGGVFLSINTLDPLP